MASTIKQALSALALTCAAASAAAAPVEVVFDIATTKRTMHEWIDGQIHTATDPDFEHVSFSIAFEFDTDHILTQNVFPGDDATPAYAFTRFAGGTGQPAFSPLYPLLHARMPANGTRHSGSDVTYSKDLQALAASPDEPVPVLEQARFVSYDGWSASDGVAPDAVAVYRHEQTIALQRQGTPLSAGQLTALTGGELVAYLQSQIGVLQVGAFSESGGILLQRYVDGVPQGPAGGEYVDAGVVFKGDVTIRSVTAVPEPGALGLVLVGVGLLWGLRTRHRVQ